MKRMVWSVIVAVVLVDATHAESITHGSTTIDMDFVDIGFAGNVADTTGYGAVGYDYRIGKYEITIDQFTKAHEADSRVGNGNEDYWNFGERTVGAGGPADYVKVYEAMKFANWITTGSAVSGAYQFSGDGITLLAVDRAAAVTAYGTVYVLPTEDEWYKAAYYKPINDGSYSLYANGSDSAASLIHGTANGWNYYNDGYVNGSPNYMWETGYGGVEQNGTYDMMGNVNEWAESAYDGTLDDMAENRVLLGGAFHSNEDALRSSSRGSGQPTAEADTLGFRVAAIPEPSSIAMIGLVSGCAVVVRRWFS